MAKSTKKKSAAAKRPAKKSKAASKKPTAKKAAAKKAPPKKPTKKAAKKAPAKKAAKKKVAKKTPAKKAAKKAPAKKAAKKAPARRLSASRGHVSQPAVRRRNTQPNFRGKKRKYYEMLVTLRDQLVDEVRTLSAQSLTSNKQAGEELADIGIAQGTTSGKFIGSDSFLREMGRGVMSDEGHRIQLIREAIERLHGKGFGICLDCSEHIQEARLEAIPYAKLCVHCKTRRETARAEGIDLDAELELTE